MLHGNSLPDDHLQSAIALSVVLPAYNESGRLPRYLETIRHYLGGAGMNPYEVIVVDDGSSDHLFASMARTSADWPQLKVIRHPRNEGKGAAVRTGVFAALGGRVLFADADGATPIEEESKLTAALAAGADLAVGSRLLADEQVERHRTWTRAALGRLFAAVVRRMFSLTVRDTQCGFKMFRGVCAKRLFSLSQETGYLFDIEILALAQHFDYRLTEVPVRWSEQPGSRLSVRKDARAIVSGLHRVQRRIQRLPMNYDSTSPR
ncbi:MAG: dolichyl-phosphate beta-glucosyltransferase [Pirellulaceae bacterium]